MRIRLCTEQPRYPAQGLPRWSRARGEWEAFRHGLTASESHKTVLPMIEARQNTVNAYKLKLFSCGVGTDAKPRPNPGTASSHNERQSTPPNVRPGLASTGSRPPATRAVWITAAPFGAALLNARNVQSPVSRRRGGEFFLIAGAAMDCSGPLYFVTAVGSFGPDSVQRNSSIPTD